MRNKKLIPFEVIEKAVAGEPEVVDEVLHGISTLPVPRMGRMFKKAMIRAIIIEYGTFINVRPIQSSKKVIKKITAI